MQALIDSNDEWIIDGKYVSHQASRRENTMLTKLPFLSHWVQLKDISYSRATDILCRSQTRRVVQCYVSLPLHCSQGLILLYLLHCGV